MSTLSPKGQALVRAGRRAYQPTDADRERLLGQLRFQLGDAALPADLGRIASLTATSSKIWPLISVIVAGVGILGGALFYPWQRGVQPQQTQLAPVAALPQPIAPTAALSDEQATGSVASAPEVEPSALPASSFSRPKDRLSSEVAILSRATHDLRAGRPADALKALDEYRRRFPQGVLGEEQRAARAQALCALGRFDEANVKLAELPAQSPLAVRAKQFCNASGTRR